MLTRALRSIGNGIRIGNGICIGTPPESLTLSGGALATLLEAAQLAARAYCRSNTAVLFTASPFAFFPVVVTVRVLPSADTTAFTSMVDFPAFFQVPV